MSTDTSTLEFTVTPSVHRVSPEARDKLLRDPGFGRVFTEHMVRISWSRERGWHDAELRPYGPLQMDPAVSVLHYAQAVFEGLKASGAIEILRSPEGGQGLSPG